MQNLFKHLFLMSVLVITSFGAMYDVDYDHTTVGFRVKHLEIANVNGNFKNFKITLDFDRATKTIKKLEAVIDARSIFTQNTQRDSSVLTGLFLNVDEFKEMKFKMTKFDKENGEIYGDLTIKDVTKNIKLEYLHNGSARDKRGRQQDGFEFVGTIYRTEFNIGKNYPINLVSDKINLIIDLQATLIK